MHNVAVPRGCILIFLCMYDWTQHLLLNLLKISVITGIPKNIQNFSNTKTFSFSVPRT